MKKYLSDVITKEKIEKLNEGERYFIVTPTGSGKTTFVLNDLHDFAKANGKKILYLYNRNILGAEILEKYESKVGDSLTVTSYQSLERAIRRGDLSHEALVTKYDYVIADEAHYFVHDAGMNNLTGFSYRFLKDQEKTATITFYITGTPQLLFTLIKETEKLSVNDLQENILANMGDFPQGETNLKEIIVVDGDKTYVKMIEELAKEDGAQGVILAQNRKLLNEYADAIEENTDLKTIVIDSQTFNSNKMEDVRTGLVEENKFVEDYNLFFMTRFFENGNSVHSYKGFVSAPDFVDSTSEKQMVARFRSQNENDKIVYLKRTPNRKRLVKRIAELEKQLSFFKLGIDEWQLKYDETALPSYIEVYADHETKQIKLNLNVFRKIKFETELEEMRAALKAIDRLQDEKIRLEKLFPKVPVRGITAIDIAEMTDAFEDFKGEWLDEDARNQLKERFIELGLAKRDDKKPSFTSIKKLVEQHLGLSLTKERFRLNKGDKQLWYWKIEDGE